MSNIEKTLYPVTLFVRGEQYFDDVDPNETELVTEGVMEACDGGWNLSYEESDLTGLQGVTTTFRIRPNEVVLDRTGKLTSQMIFVEGQKRDSLYQMEFGALMLSVCATRVMADICCDGGMIDLVYTIELEQAASGSIDYHLDIRPKN